MSTGRERSVQTYIALAVDAIGTTRFEEAFMAAINHLVLVDHCTLNSYSEDEGLTSVVVASRIDTATARSVTRAYVDGGYELDPNFPDLRRYVRTRRVIIRAHDPRRIQSKAYRDRFYSGVDVVDKIALIWYADFKAYNLNLYRTSASGPYMPAEKAIVIEWGEVIASIARQHCQHFLVQKDLSTGNMLAFLERLATAAKIPLTRRELDVCSRIALGYRMEGIAADLGIGFESAVSYRKAAYRKLGISSQGELFGLCLRNLHQFVRR
ncbi:helix-turn-helix transcriptional regulator [Arenibaculum pallidiluteum]|uniref:helix-turn-helix transcriptional regulator n=1 Tax=Arenibaculum pallidiluteum TaxID=2812559 RepID=UPI001A95C91F|nr:LuxR C-terminal-related transcriptional regulator [Arenibaculum pallidiluteum]